MTRPVMTQSKNMSSTSASMNKEAAELTRETCDALFEDSNPLKDLKTKKTGGKVLENKNILLTEDDEDPREE